ncbi:radical SAM protein [Mahella sp.]|uniref:radical SAM protein n=1 Tax=Mahella sp. TaxID=2798721 RepID=UPI0025B80E62|nr:radical SAM protein [Mahella sp.]MBZ4666134.1 putative Fe-S oxidoreductase [Mahella sp.]
MEQCAKSYRGHPCFNPRAVKEHGRIHLPVAPRCNIKCRYCDRRYSCANENRPGIAAKVMSPAEAMGHLAKSIEIEPRISVAGIAGPGDPLYNEETFKTFQMINREFPQMILCLSTNGLLLKERLYDLICCGVKTLTVTVNAVDRFIGQEIYDYVSYHGNIYRGLDAAELLIEKQLAGIEAAVKNDFLVKVNTVMIPGINEGHIDAVAKRVKELGAFIMNIMPLIPSGDFAHIPAPDCKQIEKLRKDNSATMEQMHHCRQCRADAVGML